MPGLTAPSSSSSIDPGYQEEHQDADTHQLKEDLRAIAMDSQSSDGSIATALYKAAGRARVEPDLTDDH